MPDLNIEMTWCCGNYYDKVMYERGDPECDWVEAWSDIPYKEDGKCPKCGADVSAIAIAV